ASLRASARGRDRAHGDALGSRPPARGRVAPRPRASAVPLARRLVLHALSQLTQASRARPGAGPIVDGMATGASSLVRLPIGFAAADPPAAWPPPPSLPSPVRLLRPVQELDGVGPTLERRLARVGVETTGDLLWQGPRRYEAPAPTKRVSDLFGEEEAVI